MTMRVVPPNYKCLFLETISWAWGDSDVPRRFRIVMTDQARTRLELPEASDGDRLSSMTYRVTY